MKLLEIIGGIVLTVLSIYISILVSKDAYNTLIVHYGFAPITFGQTFVYSMVAGILSGATRSESTLNTEKEKKGFIYKLTHSLVLSAMIYGLVHLVNCLMF